MAAAAVSSPSSSPRLPSPPPIAEDQIGPTSPGLSLYEDDGKLPGTSSTDTGASRRIRPGTKAEDMHEGPPLTDLQDIDSAFQLTEHLKALYSHHTHSPDSDTTASVSADLARDLARPPPGTSKEIWLYELGRFLIQKTNIIIVNLFADDPPCSASTCPEMRASEWQYLCAVHDPPKSCSAIDYCCHTLDWAANSLTSSKMFPSRLGLGSGQNSGSDKVLAQQMKEITNIFRRVYRIYAHAWFQHRDMFWRVERQTGLYILFKTVCDEYGMIQPENYTIPPEAEGHEPEEGSQEQTQMPSILSRRDDASAVKPAGNDVIANGNTTKRHGGGQGHIRNPSNVTTVIQEEAEEEESTEQKTPLERANTVVHESEIADETATAAADGEENSSKRTTITPDTMTTSSTFTVPEPGVKSEPMPALEAAEEQNENDGGDETTIHIESDGAIVETKADEPGVEVKVEPLDESEVKAEKEKEADTAK
ncbi:putative MOB kinase activator family [Septoria linicola]|nr:putative MOB kinase activator family [Septoria linicola]